MAGTGGEREVFVVPDEVLAYGRKVFGIAETLRTALDSAAGAVGEMLSDGWTGDAANEFATGWRETREGGEHMVHALRSIAEKLGVSADNYRGDDHGNAMPFTELRL
ncbi:WXG100 family type VII secretion target [Nocardia arthritidis]|uniref:WXG100 family type VII secretion target n=1 Tax=Nocardia arthritidis TaxID=228602 RepID=A0A6G9YMS2_9NOCA|nr:WXG100 family type VII secretion target [Nocardia arthritidis]QIS14336.1 WXG100 family type VII secretion target [Nocardia arthritidis]